MTGRDVVNGQVRRYRDIYMSGYLVTAAGLVIAGIMQASTTTIGAVLLLGTVLQQSWLNWWASKVIRCPWCKGHIGPATGRGFTMDHVRFCYLCGKSLDADLMVGSGPKKEAATLNELASC
jgi:hypothetical protein